jgi:hypothetical protein
LTSSANIVGALIVRLSEPIRVKGRIYDGG